MEILKKATELPMAEVELTPQQTRLWEQSRAKFMMAAPAFCHILYQMMNPKYPDKHAVFSNEVPIAGTDGLYMYLNPDTWFQYTPGERAFIMAHEVLHCIWNHPIIFHMYRSREVVTFSDGTELPYEEVVMQHAADYIINATIVESQFDGFAIPSPEKGGLIRPDITSQDTLLDAYRKVYKTMPKGKGDKGKDGNGSFDVHLKPGTGSGQSAMVAQQDRNEQEWKIAVSAAIGLAKAQGNLPGALERVLTDILDPKVSWQDYVMGWCKKRVGAGSYDFRRADRRLLSRPKPIFAPQRSGYGVNNVVVAIDTSGSIDDKTIQMFFAEMKGVLEDVKPENLYVLWCDAEVHRVDQIDDMGDLLMAKKKGAPGGGGTSFIPVFDCVRDKLGITPDALIYLTDGYGTFGPAPSYPVLWGTITKNTYPWGDVIEIPGAS